MQHFRASESGRFDHSLCLVPWLSQWHLEFWMEEGRAALCCTNPRLSLDVGINLPFLLLPQTQGVLGPLMFKGRHQRRIPQLELGECCSAVSASAGNQILKNLLGFWSFGLEFNSYRSFMHRRKVSRS